MTEQIPAGEGVRLEIDGPIATLTMDSLPLNVLSDRFRCSLYRAFEELRLRRSARVVVLKSANDRAFSTGSDVKEFPLDQGPHGGREKALFEQRMYNVLAGLPQVTIAQMEGYALGGGLELALACDLRVAAADIQIGFPEVKLGVFPCAGGSQRLLHLVGPAKAKEIMFFGQMISAPEAERLGILNRVVPRGEVAGVVDEWVRELANRPLPALLAVKAVVDGAMMRGLAAGQALEADLFADLFATEDLQEGVRAFLEKRPPQWRHR